MFRINTIFAACAIALGLAATGSKVFASGRHNKHPYHAGYQFIPPQSAYSGIRFPAPIGFGVPAYYFPGSYLPPGMTYQIPRSYPYYIPPGRAGYYYMSTHAYRSAYPW